MTAATASTTPWTGQLKDFLGQYAVAAVIFSAVDAVWLTLIAEVVRLSGW